MTDRRWINTECFKALGVWFWRKRGIETLGTGFSPCVKHLAGVLNNDGRYPSDGPFIKLVSQ